MTVPADAAARRRAGPWARLPTEAQLPRSRGLHRLSARRVAALVLDEDQRALRAAAVAAGPVARAALRLARCLASGGRVLFLGAGTSGRLGVLEAAECPPTFGTDPARIQAAVAGGRRAVFRAVEGAEDRAWEGRRRARRLGPQDVLVGISASAVTPFVLAGLEAARERGAATVLVTCAPGPRLRRLADVVVAVATGPEVVAGSTRLKAGSATKAVLNALTTTAMVQLGKVHDHLLLDLRPTSAKLRDRARRIVAGMAGVGLDVAQRLLAEAGGDVKTAVVMGRRRVSRREARRLLAGAGGLVQRTLGAAGVRRPTGVDRTDRGE